MSKCPVCDQESVFTWTDTHGVAQCQCGTPFRLYHYNENGVREDKPPECLVSEEWIPRLSQFRAETGHTIPSGCSFPGGQELATQEDIRVWNAWVDEKFPQEAQP